MSKAPQPSNHSSIYQALFIGTTQEVAIGSSSAASLAFAADVNVIRIFATKDCYIKISAAPTAVASAACAFVPGGICQFFGVTPGHKVAVIQNSSSGTLYVIEGASA